MSKGSGRRQLKVSREFFDKEYDRIFGVSEVVQTEEVEDTKAQPASQAAILPVFAPSKSEGQS